MPSVAGTFFRSALVSRSRLEECGNAIRTPLFSNTLRYGLVLLYMGTLFVVIGYQNHWVFFFRYVGLAVVFVGILCLFAGVNQVVARILRRNHIIVQRQESQSPSSAQVKSPPPDYSTAVSLGLPTYDAAVKLDPKFLKLQPFKSHDGGLTAHSDERASTSQERYSCTQQHDMQDSIEAFRGLSPSLNVPSPSPPPYKLNSSTLVHSNGNYPHSSTLLHSSGNYPHQPLDATAHPVSPDGRASGRLTPPSDRLTPPLDRMTPSMDRMISRQDRMTPDRMITRPDRMTPDRMISRPDRTTPSMDRMTPLLDEMAARPPPSSQVSIISGYQLPATMSRITECD